MQAAQDAVKQEIGGLDISEAEFDKLAAEWAKEHAGELIAEIDQTSADIVKAAIENFISTPGATMQDIIDRLPFDPVRAATIAVTETTNAYAQGQLLLGEELKNEFPDVKITKTWFTNNDEIVCEICNSFDGQEIDIDDQFEYEDISVDGPAAHVNCRCWTSVTTDIGA